MPNRENEIDYKFRESVLRLMEEKGISYRELATLTGIDHSTLHKYIRMVDDEELTPKDKKDRRVTVSRAFVIADALNTTVAKLAGRE